MTIHLNLNDMATVRLTGQGKRIYEAHHPDETAPDQLRNNLWAIMETFGPFMHIGYGNVPFVDNVIAVEVDV